MGRIGMAGALVMLDGCYLRFRDDFEAVLDPRTHTIEWLDGQVITGRIRVWPAHDACLLTSLKHYPTGAFEVHVEIAAGSKDTLVNQTIKSVEEWARDIGAAFVTIASRKGWEKVMAPHGYDHWQTEIRKEM
jgi:hypothetical protein